MAVQFVNENLTDANINLSKNQIKKLTPYLDDITYITINNKKEVTKYMSLQHRAFCWYYVHNNNNKADAYKRAFHGKYNKDTQIIEIIEPRKDNVTDFSMICSSMGYALYNKTYIKETISRIRIKHCENIKADLPQTFTEQLTIQATYDPSMFIDDKGKPKFNNWDEIPIKYRCCVEGIETRYYGKDADRAVTVIKLVDRKKAREELYKFADNLLLQPDKFEIVHKTINKDNQEVGIGQLQKMTEDELLNLLKETENGNN